MRNNAISISRVVSMMMIILCHLFSWYGIPALAQLFNVGVEVFLLISGYLYSNRNIVDVKDFLKKRWHKLCVPMYVVIVVVTIANIVFGNDYSGLKSIPIYLLDLQGVGFVFTRIQPSNIPALGPLWFLTIIMWSYIIMVIVKKYERNEFWIDSKKVKSFFIIIVIIGSVFAGVGVQISYFIVYFIGYALGKSEIKQNSKSYIRITMLMLFSMGIRLIARSIIDGTILYNNIIVSITHAVLAIWIFLTINYVYEKSRKVFDLICEMRWWKYLESHSMMIYMIHYVFLISNFNVAKLNTNHIVQICTFFVVTLITATFLQIIVKKLQSFIKS